MIVDQDGERILATPARCGTYTSEGLARKLGMICVRPGLHRMVVPPEFELYDRYIQIRDPYTRLESIYHYLHDPQNYSQWGARLVCNMNFDAWLEWMSAERLKRQGAWQKGVVNTLRSPDLWLLSLHENADLLGYDVEPVRLELLGEWFGVEVTSWKHRRRNVGYSAWSQSGLDIANHLLEALADCKWLGYEPRVMG